MYLHLYLQNVLRGIHISPYAKLLTCVRGAVYDVVIDVRPDSPTFLQWSAVHLTEENCRQLFIPPHCGHAFYSLQDKTTVVYSQVRVIIESNETHATKMRL